MSRKGAKKNQVSKLLPEHMSIDSAALVVSIYLIHEENFTNILLNHFVKSFGLQKDENHEYYHNNNPREYYALNAFFPEFALDTKVLQLILNHSGPVEIGWNKLFHIVNANIQEFYKVNSNNWNQFVFGITLVYQAKLNDEVTLSHETLSENLLDNLTPITADSQWRSGNVIESVSDDLGSLYLLCTPKGIGLSACTVYFALEQKTADQFYQRWIGGKKKNGKLLMPDLITHKAYIQRNRIYSPYQNEPTFRQAYGKYCDEVKQSSQNLLEQIGQTTVTLKDINNLSNEYSNLMVLYLEIREFKTSLQQQKLHHKLYHEEGNKLWEFQYSKIQSFESEISILT